MTDTDLIRLDAATLAAKIAAKEISSTELTRACLEQIAATDDRYHAFLHVAEEQALAARCGFVTVGLGTRTLRADTAPLAVMSALSLQRAAR